MDIAETEILLYDLSNRPASYDFVTCCATAIAHGVNHVRFVLGGWKKKDYSLKSAEERYKSIVEPAVALWGLTYSVGNRRGMEFNHLLRASIETYKKLGRIGKMPVKCYPKDYVTLTLRKSRNPERNSKEDQAIKFAAQCDRKVIIIPDWDEQPISIEDRMALYANAYVNIMVMNGPATLCFHSEAPYIVMRTIGCERSGSTSPWFSQQNGITPGFQFPWARPDQRLSYLDDTCENMMFEYAQFNERKRMAA